MDVVDRDLLREAFGDDGDRTTLDHRALQGRARRRRVSRRLTGSLVTVAAIAVVGAVAVTSQQGPRTLVVEPLAGPPPEGTVEDTDVVRGLADEMWFEIRAASDVTDEPDPGCHVWVDYGTDLHGRMGGVMVCGEVHDDRIELQTLTVGVETGAATIDSLDAETTLVLGLVDETITEVRASFSDGEVRRIATTDIRGLPDAPPFRVVVLAVQGPVSVTDTSAQLTLDETGDQMSVDPEVVGRPTDDRWIARDGMHASQSAGDAARDGVLPEVAALPFETRVEIAGSDQPMRATTDEGVWVVSRLTSEEASRRSEGCAIGATEDPDAVYRRDVVCTVEYGEVLLLDHAEERILRAYPLPGLPPQQLLVADDAVYCARTGDGGLPDGMLCRIDRDSFDAQVRIFPAASSSAFDPGGTDPSSGRDRDTGVIWLPPTWILDDGPGFTPGELTYHDDRLLSTHEGETTSVDPATLIPAAR